MEIDTIKLMDFMNFDLIDYNYLIKNFFIS
jgi:hypothetical protein